MIGYLSRGRLCHLGDKGFVYEALQFHLANLAEAQKVGYGLLEVNGAYSDAWW